MLPSDMWHAQHIGHALSSSHTAPPAPYLQAQQRTRWLQYVAHPWLSARGCGGVGYLLQCTWLVVPGIADTCSATTAGVIVTSCCFPMHWCVDVVAAMQAKELAVGRPTPHQVIGPVVSQQFIGSSAWGLTLHAGACVMMSTFWRWRWRLLSSGPCVCQVERAVVVCVQAVVVSLCVPSLVACGIRWMAPGTDGSPVIIMDVIIHVGLGQLRPLQSRSVPVGLYCLYTSHAAGRASCTCPSSCSSLLQAG